MRVFIFSNLLPEFPYKSFIMTAILKITIESLFRQASTARTLILSLGYCGSRRALANFARPRARTLVIVFFPQSHSTSFTQVLTISVTNSNASSPRANPPCRSRKSHASASVSVWFRGKERPNNEERDFRFWRKMKWEPNSERDGATLLALLKQRHANRLQAFYRENCIETCQVHVLTRVRAKWNRNGKNIFPARSRETRFTRPNSRACSQVKVWHTNFHMAIW